MSQPTVKDLIDLVARARSDLDWRLAHTRAWEEVCFAVQSNARSTSNDFAALEREVLALVALYDGALDKIAEAMTAAEVKRAEQEAQLASWKERALTVEKFVVTRAEFDALRANVTALQARLAEVAETPSSLR